MQIISGSRLGPYEIIAAIGAGGMGEVYRARDTRLNRDVAVKVLHSHRSADPRMNEIFYLAPDNTLIAVPVKSGERFSAGNPVALFATDALQFRFPFANYDVSADGQRVLVNRRLPGPAATTMTVVVNWSAELLR